MCKSSGNGKRSYSKKQSNGKKGKAVDRLAVDDAVHQPFRAPS